MHQIIFCPLLIVCLAQSQREEELGEKVENLDATEDREAREETHGATNQSKSSNKGHLSFNVLLLARYWDDWILKFVHFVHFTFVYECWLQRAGCISQDTHLLYF